MADAEQDVGPVPAGWKNDERRRVIDEVAALTVNTIAAVLYLLTMGLLLSGMPLTGLPLILVLLGAVIDLASEAWLYLRPFQYSGSLVRRMIQAHYVGAGAAYVVLVITLSGVLPRYEFYLYSLFMLLWLLAFVVGEALIIFLDDPHEPAEA